MKRSRSLSPGPSSSDESKRTKVEDEECNTSDTIIHPHILDFSDDVLLNILKYLSPQDLLAVNMSCQRLAQVTQDRTLWRTVDFRGSSLSMDDWSKYTKFLQPITTSLAIRGGLNSDKNVELTKHFFNSIKTSCKQLKELIIEECYIDGEKIQIADFPETVERLSLKGCDLAYVQSDKPYFSKLFLHTPNLTSLILSNCEWFPPHSLLVVSKLPKLRELRLDSCHRLGECVAYASLATRFGFKALEILDLRDTAMGDSEVGCFSSTKTLTHLYLECPSILRQEENHGLLDQMRQLHQVRSCIERQLVYEDRNLVQFLGERQFPYERYGFQRCSISDRAIRALGSDKCDQKVINNAAHGIIVVEEARKTFNNPRLKTLVVRNYPRVTDYSLIQLAMYASSLEYLDVTGTSVTEDGVQHFKSQRPHIEIVSSFD